MKKRRRKKTRKKKIDVVQLRNTNREREKKISSVNNVKQEKHGKRQIITLSGGKCSKKLLFIYKEKPFFFLAVSHLLVKAAIAPSVLLQGDVATRVQFDWF